MTSIIIKQNSIPEQVTNSIIYLLYNIGKNDSIESDFEGNLTITGAYPSYVDYLNQKYSNLTVTITGSPWIEFVDSLVESTLKTYHNHPDGFTLTELGTYNNGGFSGTAITLFPEFRYFTSISTVGYEAFKNCTSLQSITLPNTVNSFDTRAFEYCTSLKTINLNNITKFGERSFGNCGLEEVSLPSLTSYFPHDFGVFINSTSLKKVLDLGTISYISASMFEGCSLLLQVDLPSTVTYLKARCFWGCSNLSNLSGLLNVTTTDSNIFRGCTNLTLTQSSFPSLVSVGDTVFQNSGITGHWDLTNFTKINKTSFRYTNITGFTIPWSVISQKSGNDRWIYLSNLLLTTLNSDWENWTTNPLLRDLPQLEAFPLYMPSLITATEFGMFGVESWDRAYSTSWSGHIYWPNTTSILLGSFLISNTNFAGLFAASRSGGTISLFYLKNILTMDRACFAGTTRVDCVINNTTPPQIAATTRGTTTVFDYIDRFQSCWGGENVVNSGNTENNVYFYVPDSAVSTYQTAWPSHTHISGISSLNNGIIYATKQDWETAGKPKGLIAECLGMNSSELALFIIDNNLTYYTPPSV